MLYPNIMHNLKAGHPGSYLSYFASSYVYFVFVCSVIGRGWFSFFFLILSVLVC